MPNTTAAHHEEQHGIDPRRRSVIALRQLADELEALPKGHERLRDINNGLSWTPGAVNAGMSDSQRIEASVVFHGTSERAMELREQATFTQRARDAHVAARQR